MIKNVYEETNIIRDDLPFEWNDDVVQDKLEEFLQLNWDQRISFYDDESKDSKQSFLDFKKKGIIRTNGYIGTIKFNGGQLNIFPKMFRESFESNDTKDLNINHLFKNLIFWLEYCQKSDFHYVKISSDLSETNNFKELFVVIFINNLNRVFSKTRYFQYEDKTEDISTIRGKFNVRDFYTKKYANGIIDKFQCSYSSFEFDNLLNRIIKFTCKMLINDTSSKNQIELKNILMRLSDVEDVYCSASDCRKVKISSVYDDYRIILSLCEIFLLNSYSNYDDSNFETMCFLFPTYLLFEGFIGGFIKDTYNNIGSITLQASDKYLVNRIQYDGREFGQAFKMRHDILCEIKDKGLFILDTKYKKIHRFEESEDDTKNFRKSLTNEVSQDDLYQVAVYAAKRNLKKAFLLYPLFRKEENEKDMVKMEQLIIQDAKEIEDLKFVDIYLVRIPFIFEDNIEAVKNNLKMVLDKIFET